MLTIDERRLTEFVFAVDRHHMYDRSQIMTRGLIAVVLVLPLSLACSSDHNESPSDQCNHLGQTVCEANANCAVEKGDITHADRSAFVSNCVSGFKQSLDCSRVTKVTGHPNACEADVAATPCAQFMLPAGLPLPASCRSIFQ